MVFRERFSSGRNLLLFPDDCRIIGEKDHMYGTDGPGVTPGQERELRIAAENTCELCREYHPPFFLEIHQVSRRLSREMERDPSTRILIVCKICHDHIHNLPLSLAKQRALVKKRSFFTRRDMRRILGYQPRPYKAPDDVNLFVIYEEYLGRSPPGSYRLSG